MCVCVLCVCMYVCGVCVCVCVCVVCVCVCVPGCVYICVIRRGCVGMRGRLMWSAASRKFSRPRTCAHVCVCVFVFHDTRRLCTVTNVVRKKPPSLKTPDYTSHTHNSTHAHTRPHTQYTYNTHSLTHSLTHALTHSLTHSLTDALTHKGYLQQCRLY